ncbi:hypothetical protein GYH30_018636 [Glycine max]|nr:hypothetical protein GYH30_018636 [Glycine max]
MLKLNLLPWLFQVYDPPPSCEFMCIFKVELDRTREAVAQALTDCAHVEKKAPKWFMTEDYFYKINGWKPPRPPTLPSNPINLSSDSDDFGDEFLWKLDEEVVKDEANCII